jgi:ABC-2 type transport system permease protein
MRGWWHYARSLRSFWSTSLAAELEYPLNAAIELVSVLGNLAGSLFVLQLLFAGGTSLGGWSWNGALVVLGFYTLLDGITTCVLQPNLSRIVNHVQTGTLDYVLLKPIDSQFWLSTRTVSPWGLPPFWPPWP